MLDPRVIKLYREELRSLQPELKHRLHPLPETSSLNCPRMTLIAALSLLLGMLTTLVNNDRITTEVRALHQPIPESKVVQNQN